MENEKAVLEEEKIDRCRFWKVWCHTNLLLQFHKPLHVLFLWVMWWIKKSFYIENIKNK